MWCELGLGTRYYDIQLETVSETGPAAEIKRQNTAKWKCWRILGKLWQKCGGKNNTIAAVLGITQYTIQHTIGVIRNGTVVFRELYSINFKNLCAYHREEVLRIPKPQHAQFH